MVPFMNGGRSENMEGASSNMGGGHNLPPYLVEIRLTDMPGACAALPPRFRHMYVPAFLLST